jgi:hypothetical protein
MRCLKNNFMSFMTNMNNKETLDNIIDDLSNQRSNWRKCFMPDPEFCRGCGCSKENGKTLYENELKRQLRMTILLKNKLAAEAYQVIGALAYETEEFDNPNVIKALDYFGDIANGESPTRVKEILPWSLNDEHEAT